MYKRDQMLEEIHAIRREMWKESKEDPHLFIAHIREEAKAFIEEQGYNYHTEGSHRRIVK